MPEYDVNFQLGVDSKTLREGFREAGREQDKYVRDTERGFNRMRIAGVASALAMAGGFAGLTATITSFVRSGLSANREILEFSRNSRTALSTSAGLRTAFRRFGVDAADASTAVGSLNERISDLVTDRDRLERAFGRGSRIADLLVQDPSNQLRGILNSFQNVSQEEIGRRARELFPGLENAIPLITRYREEFERANRVASTHHRELNLQLDQWRALRSDIRTAAEVLSGAFLRGLTQSLTGTTSLSDLSLDLLERSAELADTFEDFGMQLGEFVNRLGELVGTSRTVARGLLQGISGSFSEFGREGNPLEGLSERELIELQRRLEERRSVLGRGFDGASEAVSGFFDNLIQGIRDKLAELEIIRQDEERTVLRLRELVATSRPTAFGFRGRDVDTIERLRFPAPTPATLESLAEVQRQFTSALELVSTSTRDGAQIAREYLEENQRFKNALSEDTNLIEILYRDGVLALSDAIIDLTKNLSAEAMRIAEIQAEFFPRGLNFSQFGGTEDPRNRFAQATPDIEFRRRTERTARLVDDFFGRFGGPEGLRQQIQRDEEDPRARFAQAEPDLLTRRLREEAEERQRDMRMFAEQQAENLLSNFTNSFETAFQAFVAGPQAGDLKALGDNLLNAFTLSIARSFTSAVFKPITDGIAEGFFASFSQSLTNVGIKLGELLSNIVGGLFGGGGGGFLGGLLGFQEGGFVPGRRGQPQLAVVHGQELILNPEQIAALGSGGGLTLNFSFNGTTNADEVMRVVEQSIPEIAQAVPLYNLSRGRS